MRKGNKIKKILDGETSLLKLKGFLMFEDNWICKNNKILYNQDNISFSVLDFKEIEDDVIIVDATPYKLIYGRRKFSCVKLNKFVNLTDVFYTEKNNVQ